MQPQKADIRQEDIFVVTPKLFPAGDSAVTVEFDTRIDPVVNDRVHLLMKKLNDAHIEGIREQIPAFASLLIIYDPRLLSFDTLSSTVIRLCSHITVERAEQKRIHLIPCCYGMHFGPDLRDVEKASGLTRDEIIHLHSSVDYRIYMLGFLPGFVYLGGLDERLIIPRLKTPRTKIPAGSVGIGGSQTGIYPLDSPGGWRLIGCTPLDVYDPQRENPVLMAAGEYIRFCPVSACDYYDIRQMQQKGNFRHEIITVKGEC